MWLIDFLILHGYTEHKVLFWKKCLDEFKIPLRFEGFKVPNTNNKKDTYK
jgi:hypothetical protein